MPSRPVHTPDEYDCPPSVFLVLTTANLRGYLMPFAWCTDLDEACHRAGNVNGVIVALPVIRCYLPPIKEWSA
jgi:hypothetical protein